MRTPTILLVGLLFSLLITLLTTQTTSSPRDSLYLVLEKTQSDTAKHRIYLELIKKCGKEKENIVENLAAAALANARKLPEEKLLETHLQLGYAYKGRHATDLFQQQFETILTFEPKPSTIKYLGIAHYQLGAIQLNRGEFDAAIKNQKHAIRYVEQEQAIKYDVNSLSIKECFGEPKTISIAHHNIAAVRLDLKEYELVKEAFEKSMKIAQKAGISFIVLYNHQRLGDIAQDLSKVDTALFHHQETLEISESTGFKTGVISGYYNLGKDYEKRIGALEQSSKIVVQESLLLKASNRMFSLLAFALLSLLLLGAYFFRQLRQSKQEIEVKNVQLKKLNATKDKFFGIIAHDIRSPIIALDSIGEQMQYYLQKKDKAKLKRLAGRIENITSRLTSLLDNLLQWALLQTGMIPYQPTQMDVQEVAQENVELYQEVAALKNIRLRNEVAANTLVFADNRAITTIIRNLVNNAIKFTPKGGQVSIGTKIKGKKIFISINDTGTGIAADKIAKLFSLQKKIKKGTAGEKGTGLGLLLCKDLVEMNRGTIRVISQLGKGSSFIFSLPKT